MLRKEAAPPFHLAISLCCWTHDASKPNGTVLRTYKGNDRHDSSVFPSRDNAGKPDGLRTSQLVPDTVKQDSQLGPKAASRYAADAEETHAPAQTFLPTAAKSLTPQTAGARSQIAAPLPLQPRAQASTEKNTRGSNRSRNYIVDKRGGGGQDTNRLPGGGYVFLLRAKP